MLEMFVIGAAIGFVIVTLVKRNRKTADKP